MSTRPQAAHGAGPQVVVGITGPRSEDFSLETREARGPAPRADVASTPAPKLEVLAEPTLELVNEAEREALVRENNLEIIRESVELVRARLELAPASEDGEDGETEDVQPSQSEEREEHESPAPPTNALPTPDEMSIPPVGDLSVEPIADRFFSQGERVLPHLATVEDEWGDVANTAMRKSLPEVAMRRARFAKYVRWAVGGAVVVCLAAVARTALMPVHPAASMPAAAALEAVAPAAKAATLEAIAPATAVVETPAAVAAATIEPAKTAEPVVPTSAESAKAEPAAPAEAAVVAKNVAAVPNGEITALQAKNDARRSLERGKLADAIEAGERSVALDPTDGEAWLLLGAAYQEKGQNADARRCYAACLKEGKRGPLDECRAMLR